MFLQWYFSFPVSGVMPVLNKKTIQKKNHTSCIYYLLSLAFNKFSSEQKGE